MIELRFVKREITTPAPGMDDSVFQVREIRILQMRHKITLIGGVDGGWDDWTDVPLVEPEDE